VKLNVEIILSDVVPDGGHTGRVHHQQVQAPDSVEEDGQEIWHFVLTG
jgi:hypothetical protein